MTAIPPQKTQTEIRPPFYTPPGSREGTQLRNENNNSSYKPAPPPRKSAFDIKNHTNPPKVSHRYLGEMILNFHFWPKTDNFRKRPHHRFIIGVVDLISWSNFPSWKFQQTIFQWNTVRYILPSRPRLETLLRKIRFSIQAKFPLRPDWTKILSHFAYANR